MRYTIKLIIAFLFVSSATSAQQWRWSPYYWNYPGMKVDGAFLLPYTTSTDAMIDRDGALRYNPVTGTVQLWKSPSWSDVGVSTNMYNTSSNLTGDRVVSGFASSTIRRSLTFNELSNFEVRAYGSFGAYDPAYTGMRIVMNSGAGAMLFDWQSAAGRGAVSVSPGSAALSAQQASTDSRLNLSIDGNKLLLNNPTTSGTNQLFQIDRAGGAVTLYGYPNPGGQVLTTDATGKLQFVPAGGTSLYSGDGTISTPRNVTIDPASSYLKFYGAPADGFGETYFQVHTGNQVVTTQINNSLTSKSAISTVSLDGISMSNAQNGSSGRLVVVSNGINLTMNDASNINELLVGTGQTQLQHKDPATNNGLRLTYDYTGGIRLYSITDNTPTSVGQWAPNGVISAAGLDVSNGTGYDQLILRNTYTPTSSADVNGTLGSMSWDENFIYIKTAGGWKRTELSTF